MSPQFKNPAEQPSSREINAQGNAYKGREMNMSNSGNQRGTIV